MKSSSSFNLDISGRETILSRRRGSRETEQPPVGVAHLRGKRFDGYLRYAIPHELDSEVDAVIQAYTENSASGRQRAIDDLNARSASALSVYGQRMASTAVRSRSIEPLVRGIIAVGMAEERLGDARENLYPLVAINDSATLIGTSIRTLISTVSDLLPPRALEKLQEFDQRQEQDKSLEAMGLRRFGSGQNFLYS
ncbi:hypothetical protein ACWDQL_23205 [Streptomyces olivaceus]